MPGRPVGRLFGASIAVLATLLLILAAPAGAVQLPSGFSDEVLPFQGLGGTSGPKEPTMVRFSPDGRVFVAQKTGDILVYDSLEDSTPTVFDDLRTQVYDNGDRGLLSIALDPEFPTKPYVYALYTYNYYPGAEGPAPSWEGASPEGDPCPKPSGAKGDCPVSGRLVRLTAEGDHAVGEEKVLVEGWCQQFNSHSIGDLQFGPEGNLYASGGDGASYITTDYGQFGWPELNQCADPPGQRGEALSPPTAEGGSLRSQNLDNLDGKVIRVDPETGEGVPANPYSSSSNPDRRRIVALGFRNPFRFALDPDNGDLYVDNVGWDTYEEIDHIPANSASAYNSGWPCYEGPKVNGSWRFINLDVCNHLYETPGSTSPPWAYSVHGTPVTPGDPCPAKNGSAITGVTVDDSEALPPAYRGSLFFADSIRGCIYVARAGPDGKPDPANLEPFATGAGTYPGVDLEVGPGGDLYYVDLYGPGPFGETYGPGSIHRISYSAVNQPPTARLSADKTYGALPLSVTFDASGSSDADGETLSYEWDPENDGSFEAPTASATKTLSFESATNRTVAVRVRDAQGAATVARLTVYPGDAPPVPTITAPAESSPGSGEAALHWAVGDPIQFEGDASDAQDGTLSVGGLEWTARLYHCPTGPTGCHIHPLQSFPHVSSGTLIAPDHDYPSHLELVLSAVDSRGLGATRTIQIYPTTVQLRLQSQPPGLELTAGLRSEPTPFEVTTIQGSNIDLSAPETQTLEGTEYSFEGWSDGGDRVHSIFAEADATYTAIYAEVGGGEEESGGGEEEGGGGEEESGGGEEEGGEEESGGGEEESSGGEESGEEEGGGGEEEEGGSEEEGGGETPPGKESGGETPPAEKGTGTPPGGGGEPLVGPPAPEILTVPAPRPRLLARPHKRTRLTSARFAFAADREGAGFECRLDGGPFQPCRSGRRFRGLTLGPHVFRLRAGVGGETGPILVYRWTVLPVPVLGRPGPLAPS